MAVSLADDGKEGLVVYGSPTQDRWRLTAARPITYEVRVCPDLLDPANGALAGAGFAPQDASASVRRLVVLDSRVADLHGQDVARYFEARGVSAWFHTVDAREQTKTMDSVIRVVTAMEDFGLARRREPVIAIGGGVLTDVVGTAAAMYRRSTPYVRVPTTLLGMVDASIGAKTGVNYGRHKNRLGGYHPSTETLVDPAFLRTLDARNLRNGLAEVLKVALIKDPALFELLEAHGPRLVEERFQTLGSRDDGAAAARVLRRAIHGMLEELQPNLWELELRRLMDYGHSFSPMLEMAAMHDLLHGEAVSIDMAMSTRLACDRGLMDEQDAQRITAVFRALALPTWHPLCTPELLVEALNDTVRHRDGRQHLPLPVGIGAGCFIEDVTAEQLAAAADRLRSDHESGPKATGGRA